jgi:phosphoglycolate phosphatase-like HAD superfamily hydrolase
MSDPFTDFNNIDELDTKWIMVPSELEGIDGRKKDIKVELIGDGKPRAIAFFDIDGTLAHLSAIHGKAIARLFQDEDPSELEETFYRGFKLGNSFREFDRMRGIYVDGQISWKDPEVYLRARFNPHAKEIDEPGNLAHSIAAAILKEYGEIAARVAEELYKQNPEKFEASNIAPIFLLARMYARLGIPLVGFTANAKSLVDKLAKYLKLSDIFLDIATDETMAGGGKEIAIQYLINKLATKGIQMPENRLIFVGDSLRGDIGISLTTGLRDKGISGQGILVLKDREELLEIQKQISADGNLRRIADEINVHGLVISDVPLDEKGNPMLLSRYKDRFLKKL